MPRYWWVNHKQTFCQEIDGTYLWSPKRKANGARNTFYDNMRAAAPGDLVLSYAAGLIRHVGRVAEFAFTAPKPEEFGNTGGYWSAVGWLLPVYWVPLAGAVRPRDLIATLGPLLPDKYSPIQPATGHGLQSVYLAEIPQAVFDTVPSTMEELKDDPNRGEAILIFVDLPPDFLKAERVNVMIPRHLLGRIDAASGGNRSRFIVETAEQKLAG